MSGLCSLILHHSTFPLPHLLKPFLRLNLPSHRLRLVMPPLLFFVLSYPFTQLAHLIFPKSIANGIISGAFFFYILYDCMHYALHHSRLPQYLAEMKKYHLAHHYKSECFGLGSGVLLVHVGRKQRALADGLPFFRFVRFRTRIRCYLQSLGLRFRNRSSCYPADKVKRRERENSA